MKRDLMEFTGGRTRGLAAAAGWERVSAWHDEEYGDLIKWRRRSDGREVVDNEPDTFPEPLRQAMRARMLCGLLLECPRCGEVGVRRDPGGLTAEELDRAQVVTVAEIQTSTEISLTGDAETATAAFDAAVEQVDEPGHVVLLHDHECEVAPVNLDELGRSRWN